MNRSPRIPDLGSVTLITVSYGSREALRPLLESVREHYGAALRVVVADNKPDLDSVQELAAEFNAVYLPLPENPGYGAAINMAAARYAADAEWIFVCNPDLELSAGSIEALINTGREIPDAGIIGPEIHQPDGSVYPSARTVPSLRTGVGHALLVNIWPGNPWSAKYHNEGTPGTRATGWLSGACLLIRGSVFRELGGFDDGYFMYFEDVDLGYRAGLAGYQNIYEPAAVVTHTGAHSTRSNSGKMLRVHHQSAARFLSKKYSHPLLWPLRVLLRAALTIRARLLTLKMP